MLGVGRVLWGDKMLEECCRAIGFPYGKTERRETGNKKKARKFWGAVSMQEKQAMRNSKLKKWVPERKKIPHRNRSPHQKEEKKASGFLGEGKSRIETNIVMSKKTS